jgi:hypothetical protein
MKVLQTEVQRDHLERLVQVRPSVALAELIWNALDADASRIDVSFERDFSGGVTALVITDNGTGISELDSESGFRNLGGSWKRTGGVTRRDKRVLHGKDGQGRFAAFALGADVTWTSVTAGGKGLEEVSIGSSTDRLGEFRVSDVKPLDIGIAGTTVRVTTVPEQVNRLTSPEATDELNETFALYLRQYPHIAIRVDGERLDPQSLQTLQQDYTLAPIAIDERLVTGVVLTVVEWRHPTSRSLFFCNAEGISRLSLPVQTLKAPGYEFTAYIRAALVQELYESNDLFMGNTNPAVDGLYQAAIAQLRDHFRRRTAERAAELVDEWKRKGVYPYEGEAGTPTEVAERQVFDVLAVNVNAYLPDFASVDSKTQRFSFGLLRRAIENNPESMQKILTDVLGLPKNRLDDLAELLGKTSLVAIIAASKLVADRLNVLQALEVMLFEPEPKKELLERRQLHRILADHTWIFGEEYNLSVDDESLTSVLKQHIKLLGRDEVAPKTVRGAGGKQQIVDMMLSRRIPQPQPHKREHLVVELKRPSQSIDKKVFTQITDYALAVAADARFQDVETNWVFWALSTERDDFVKMQASQPNRPNGIIGQVERPQITIWAKSWADVINAARSRLEFYRQQLEYSVDRESALDHLRKTHARYFPASLTFPPEATDGAT